MGGLEHRGQGLGEGVETEWLMWEETEGDETERREGYRESREQRGKSEAVGKVGDQIWVRRKGGTFGEGRLRGGGWRKEGKESKSDQLGAWPDRAVSPSP